MAPSMRNPERGEARANGRFAGTSAGSRRIITSRKVGIVSPRDEAEFSKRPRYLFVVSRHYTELYELLVERFQGDKNVEVVLDRRAARNEGAHDYGAIDRRQRRPPKDDLTRRSHLIITRTD